MTNQELYLKTLFCCMACDGEIAQEEVELVKSVVEQSTLFEGMDVQGLLHEYVSDINKSGALFLSRYLSALSDAELTEDEQMRIVGLAIKMIEADNIIQYAEVKFFKKIRVRLSLSDEMILEKYPHIEDFLLPDINVYEAPAWGDVTFKEFFLKEGQQDRG